MLAESVSADCRVSQVVRQQVERVASFKLLGVYIASDLKWGQHIDTITSKAALRLYFLKQLKRSGAGQRDLLCFYTTIIRLVPGQQRTARHCNTSGMSYICSEAFGIGGGGVA